MPLNYEQAKDKEIAELKIHKDQNDRMRGWFEERTGLKDELLSAHMKSIDQQITDLKAEIERYKELILTLKMD